ncbi:hypothetical protein [Paenibacillus motobuensis]|uniref:DUF2140 family protein n=1 Tax=Paenibacillus motobuensis TaxID=295324 RepID=A0ABN0YV00_9BACL
MKKGRLIIGSIIILLVVLITAIVLYIRPSRTLDMNYSELNWKNKLVEMVESRNTELTLTESDVNNLLKKGLTEYVAEHDLPFQIIGADFKLNGNQIIANMNGAWGLVNFGATAKYSVEYADGTLLLNPSSVEVRNISISPERIGLEAMTIHLTDYIPKLVTINEVNFPGKAIQIKFTLDLLELFNYLQSS